MGNTHSTSETRKSLVPKVEEPTAVKKSYTEKDQYRKNVMNTLRCVLLLKDDLFQEYKGDDNSQDEDDPLHNEEDNVACDEISSLTRYACMELKNLHKLLIDVHLRKKGKENYVSKSINPAIDHCYNAMNSLAKISSLPNISVKKREKISDYISRIPGIVSGIYLTQPKPDLDTSGFFTHIRSCTERALMLLEHSLKNSNILSQSPYMRFTLNSVSRAFALVKLIDHRVSVRNIDSMIYLATYNIRMLSLAFEIELNRGFKVSPSGIPLEANSPYQHSIAAIAATLFTNALNKQYLLYRSTANNETVCDFLMSRVYLFEGKTYVQQAFSESRKVLSQPFTALSLVKIEKLFEDAMLDCDKLEQDKNGQYSTAIRQQLLKKVEHIYEKIGGLYNKKDFSLPCNVLLPLDKAVIAVQRLMDKLDSSRVLYDYNWEKNLELPLFPNELILRRKVERSSKYPSVGEIYQTYKNNSKKSRRSDSVFSLFCSKKPSSKNILKNLERVPNIRNSTKTSHEPITGDVDKTYPLIKSQNVKLSPLAQIVSRDVSAASIESLHMYVYSRGEVVNTPIEEKRRTFCDAEHNLRSATFPCNTHLKKPVVTGHCSEKGMLRTTAQTVRKKAVSYCETECAKTTLSFDLCKPKQNCIY